MERQIEQIVTNILKTKVTYVKRLLGGMSNYTCILKDENNKYYTFRIPGKNADKFVDRNEEKYNLELLTNFNLTTKTLYLDTNTGYKISEFIEGDILSEVGFESYLDLISESLHQLHNLDCKAYDDYNKLKRLQKYEEYCKELNYKIDDKYYEYKKIYLNLYNEFKDYPKVFSHGDFQPSNLIHKDNKIYIVDFEFTANNDPYYDIACFGNINFCDAVSLLKVYLNRDYTKEEYKRLIENRLFQTLQWYLVATYKNLIGLSEDLKLDFNKIATNYLIKSKDLIDLL